MLTESGGMRLFFFFSSRRRHTRFDCDWSSDVCSSDLAAAARRQARRAGGVPVLGADPFVGRAMLQAARRTDAHVLVARRLLVHATLRDTVLAAEVLGTDRAARRARLAAAVVVPADHQGRGRTTAMRTREHPSRPTTEGPLGAERREIGRAHV